MGVVLLMPVMSRALLLQNPKCTLLLCAMAGTRTQQCILTAEQPTCMYAVYKCASQTVDFRHSQLSSSLCRWLVLQVQKVQLDCIQAVASRQSLHVVNTAGRDSIELTHTEESCNGK